MGLENRWNGGSTRKEVFEVITTSPTSNNSNEEGVQSTFLDSLVQGPELPPSVRTHCPSSRPERNGPLPCDMKLGLEKHDGVHLIPKRTISTGMDKVLSLRNPILSSVQLLQEMDNSEHAEFFDMIFSLKGDMAWQTSLLGRTKQVEDICRLLEDSSPKVRESILSSIHAFGTFLEWLSNPGYDFVFAPSSIPDYLLKAEDIIVDISGGRCDAFGIDIEGPLTEEVLEVLGNAQMRKMGSVSEVLDYCTERGVPIKKVDVLEFKLGSQDSLNKRELKGHEKQIQKYTDLLCRRTYIPVGGKLIYFNHDISIVPVTPTTYEDWITQELKSAREGKDAKVLQIRGAEIKRAIDQVALVRNPYATEKMVKNIVENGKVCVLDLVALSHFKGAEMLSDGSIVIYLTGDSKIVVRRDDVNALYGDNVIQIFNNRRYEENALYKHIVAAFNNWGKRLCSN